MLRSGSSRASSSIGTSLLPPSYYARPPPPPSPPRHHGHHCHRRFLNPDIVVVGVDRCRTRLPLKRGDDAIIFHSTISQRGGLRYYRRHRVNESDGNVDRAIHDDMAIFDGPRRHRVIVRTSSSFSTSSTPPKVDADDDDVRPTPTRRRSTPSAKLEDDRKTLTLSHFIASASSDDGSVADPSASTMPMVAELDDEYDDDIDLHGPDTMVGNDVPPILAHNAMDKLGRRPQSTIGTTAIAGHRTLKFHLRTYGCQMNVNDTDIVRSILLNHHRGGGNDAAADDVVAAVQGGRMSGSSSSLRFVETNDEIDADVLLTNTCAIRENAEVKVWNRLRELRSHDRNFPLPAIPPPSSSPSRGGCRDDDVGSATTAGERYESIRKDKPRKRIIGVLGCMAERLKDDMFRDGTADVVVGPDAYRDLPRLITMLSASSYPPSSQSSSSLGMPTERAVNVRLSLDETYASIAPIRSNPDDVSAFVSIMRGCNNMCSYCVVPFTRGRERSRELESVVGETKRLLEEEGIREVILLGQNVNSYHDARGGRPRGWDDKDGGAYRTSNDGFSNVFRLRQGDGHRFVDLLGAVSDLSPELRVRFTSPHPKDYPPPLLDLMAERTNICKHLHMPAQSGSSAVLERMRRGYTREAYMALIEDVRDLIPDVAISSDFITGFCGETEDEHDETLSLMDAVQFDQAFMFAYSMREKTHAHRTMIDDVHPDVKNRRLNEVIDNFRRNVQIRNERVEIGRLRLVLVEGEAKRSTAENKMLSGRTDQNKRVVFASEMCWAEEEITNAIIDKKTGLESLLLEDLARYDSKDRKIVELSRGDYAVVQITDVRGHTLKGRGLMRSSIVGFDRLMNMKGSIDDSLRFVV